MKNYLTASLFLSLLLFGGCSTTSVLQSTIEVPRVSTPVPTVNTTEVVKTVQIVEKMPESDFALPISEYGERLRYKNFGEYIQDRFKGYHVGDDIEYADERNEVPVLSIANGVVVHSGKVEGYGGLIIIKHAINGKTIHSMYGHLDLSSTQLKKADRVMKGDFLANLGEDQSDETDGERKHLHFALYEGEELRLKGYEASPEKVGTWINPYDFLLSNGVGISKQPRLFVPNKEIGGDIFGIQFLIPEGWEVEYIPSIKALNLFSISGSGTARDRSQILIRYFDAANFLTLPTVTVYKTTDLEIGKRNYSARRYDIEKKPGIADFAEQPAWRNIRHLVTDFRGQDGFGRYYVVAANPRLDMDSYASLLASMSIEP